MRVSIKKKKKLCPTSGPERKTKQCTKARLKFQDVVSLDKTRKPPFAVLFKWVLVSPSWTQAKPAFRIAVPGDASKFFPEGAKARARRWGEWGCGWRGILAPGYFTMLLKHTPPHQSPTPGAF